MGVSYGTRQGVQGKARRSLSLPAREVASVDTALDRIELEPHGLTTDDPVQFRIETGGTLPAPLAAGVVYYAKPVTDSSSLFQVAAAPGGAAIDLTTVGVAPFSLVVAVGKMIDDALEHQARWIDALYTAHGVPFVAPYPKVIVNANEYFALFDVVHQLRLSKDFADLLAWIDGTLRADFLRMASSGADLRDDTATAKTMLAVSRSAASSVEATRGTIP